MTIRLLGGCRSSDFLAAFSENSVSFFSEEQSLLTVEVVGCIKL